MSNQQTQLEVMATGGFDIQSTEQDQLAGGLSPLSLLLIKEQVEENCDNPCVGCIHEHDTDPHVLDFCHTTCQEPAVEPMVLDDEVTCCIACGQYVSRTISCDCES